MAGPAADPSAPQTFRLIYRSHSLIPEQGRRAALGELFSTARSVNKSQHITGALLLREDWFVQALEGDEDAVRGLFEHIATDPRHDQVEVLDAGAVPARVFARWAMAQVGGDGEPDIPLIAHLDGISPAAARGDATDEQQAVLQVMRDAAPH